jgi:hypothetical protein
LSEQPKKYARPPNRTPAPESGAAGALKGKVGPPRPSFPPGQPDPPPGGPGIPSSVVITIGEVKITIEGPFSRVLWALRWLFGTSQPEAVIKALKVQFGPEVSLRQK